METERRDLPDEHFQTSGKGFRVLDKVLATSLIKICSGQLGRKVHQKMEDAQKRRDSDGNHNPRALKGREILRFILESQMMDRTACVIYELRDLMAALGLEIADEPLP